MLAALLALLALPVSDEPVGATHPADQPPAGASDVRAPQDGAWRLALASHYTRFDGMRDHSQRIDTDEVLGLGYAQTPESMETTSVEIELLFAVSDSFTLHASVPWITNSMDLRTNLGESFTTDSSGIGDTHVGADLVVWALGEQSVSTGISVGIPTGSITEKGGLPGAVPTQLEYAMQLGSGTLDLSARIDYRIRADPYSYGVALAGTAHTGHNDQDYALGDRFDATAWGAQEWSPAWSGSARVSVARCGNVRGGDPDLDPALSPSNDPDKQGGARFDGALGVNWMPFGGGWSGSVVGVEVGMPLAQDLNGPQLSEDWFASLRVGLSF